jgi:hypothetical protein
LHGEERTIEQKLNGISERFRVDCCDGEVKLSWQFARLIENRMYDLVDRSRFSPLAFVIRKPAFIILSEGKAMKLVVKVSRCMILATCHGASTKFTQKVSIDENASPCYQIPTPRNTEIDERAAAWIVFSMTSRWPCCEANSGLHRWPASPSHRREISHHNTP